MKKRNRLIMLGGLTLLAGSGAASAEGRADTPLADTQQTQQPAIDEVIVTARRREESLQRVPVAVSAISAVQIRNHLASDLTQLAELAPQVSITQGGAGTGALITIRGISSASNDAGLDQSVLTDIDEVPISRGQIISASVFDLASVQVMQGPQALFFGKNSPAGVIALRSADPRDRFEGYITGGYEFNAREAYTEGALSGPLSDTLKARVAWRVSHMDGWMRNIASPVQDIVNPSVTDPGADGQSRNGAHSYAGRGTLVWTPDSSFEAKLKVTWNRSYQSSVNFNSEPFCVGGRTQPVLLGTVALPQADCQRNQVKAVSAVAPVYADNFPNGNGGMPYMRSNFVLASLTMKKTWDKISLISTTGFYTQTVSAMGISDWSPYATIWSSSRERYTLLTQEWRANTSFSGPFNVMAGAYFEHFTRPFTNSADLFHAYNPIADNYTTATIDSYTQGSYISLFAEGRWQILPTVELAGGARWSHDEKAANMYNIADNPNSATGATLLPSNQAIRANYADDHISPSVTLSWHPRPAQTLYAAYKTGYKGGGISTPFLLGNTATAQNLTFQPERSYGFEAGYKASLFNHRLRFDLTAYRYEYKNLQVVSYNAETINFILQNAAAARIQGVQGSFDWLAARGLTLSGNFGYNKATYTQFSNAPCYTLQTDGCVTAPDGETAQNLTGKSLLRAPRLTFSLGADYEHPLSPAWLAKLSVRGSHTSSYQAATDYAPAGLQNAYWLLDAAVHLTQQHGPLDVAVIGRNLTNSYYMLMAVGWSGSNVQNQEVGFFNRPREVAVQATIKW